MTDFRWLELQRKLVELRIRTPSVSNYSGSNSDKGDTHRRRCHAWLMRERCRDAAVRREVTHTHCIVAPGCPRAWRACVSPARYTANGKTRKSIQHPAHRPYTLPSLRWRAFGLCSKPSASVVIERDGTQVPEAQGAP